MFGVIDIHERAVSSELERRDITVEELAFYTHELEPIHLRYHFVATISQLKSWSLDLVTQPLTVADLLNSWNCSSIPIDIWISIDEPQTVRIRNRTEVPVHMFVVDDYIGHLQSGATTSLPWNVFKIAPTCSFCASTSCIVFQAKQQDADNVRGDFCDPVIHQ